MNWISKPLNIFSQSFNLKSIDSMQYGDFWKLDKNQNLIYNTDLEYWSIKLWV